MKRIVVGIRGGQQAHAAHKTDGVCPAICTFIGARPEIILKVKKNERQNNITR